VKLAEPLQNSLQKSENKTKQNKKQTKPTKQKKKWKKPKTHFSLLSAQRAFERISNPVLYLARDVLFFMCYIRWLVDYSRYIGL
jgi:CCR4-NOT transcriptional regulation complex NOT5 subunit